MFCRLCALRTISDTSKTVIFQNAVLNKIILRLCSTAVNDNLTQWNKVKLKFSDKQLALVLKTLNNCNIIEMKKYGIKDSGIKILESLQNQSKSCTSLDDFVLHDVVEVPQLEGICSAIAKGTKKSKKSSIVSPVITREKLCNIKTAVGLRIGSNHISWAQLDLTGSNCNILQWSSQSVSDLPLNAGITEIIKKGMYIAKSIPDADAYVMEKESSKQMTKMNSSLIRILLRQQQLNSSVLTALCARNNSNSSKTDFFSSFYTMRSFAPAQLFGLFLGSETVSANDIIQALLQQQNVGLNNISSISLTDKEIANYYASVDTYRKEELNMSLLLTLTFFELAVLE